MSYLNFYQLPPVDGRKTNQWQVFNAVNGHQLGLVTFSGAWRKFVFQTHPAITYDSGCFRELAEFLDERTKEWRDKL
jgi:hypothetical protein